MSGLAGNKVPDEDPVQLDGLARALRPGVDRARPGQDVLTDGSCSNSIQSIRCR